MPEQWGPGLDKDKIRRLREKYANAKGSDVFDPEFRKVASLPDS